MNIERKKNSVRTLRKSHYRKSHMRFAHAAVMTVEYQVQNTVACGLVFQSEKVEKHD
jgi:hypothetical protein